MFKCLVFPYKLFLIHISAVVLCCSCFHTMPRAGWMLSKCGFTWAIKWAVLFLCCSDTFVGAAFKGIIGLFCSFIYWNAAQFLSLTLKFLSIISCDSFLQSFSLWIARIIFIFSIFVFSWNQIPSLAMMVVYLLFLPTPAVLLFATASKNPQKNPTFARQPGAFHSAVAAATALTRWALSSLKTSHLCGIGKLCATDGSLEF